MWKKEKERREKAWKEGIEKKHEGIRVKGNIEERKE